MHRNPNNVFTKQERIATLAKQSPEMGFTSLAYLMDKEWLREAYRRTRKDGAVGIDDQTSAEYEQELEGNLQSLLDRAKSGRYLAPPVRRVHIPKAGSATETRPIGIPTLEDKILQRAVVMLLEPIYEQDFLDGSYGFRPSRSAHLALESLWKGLMNMGGGWVLEVDIRKFFDTLDHAHLREFLQHWSRSRRGTWVVKRQTASNRLTRGLRAITEWCRRHRHLPVREQHRKLSEKLRGHCAYYGITGNSSSLSGFRMHTHRIWRYWLSRRNRERSMTWETVSVAGSGGGPISLPTT